MSSVVTMASNPVIDPTNQQERNGATAFVIKFDDRINLFNLGMIDRHDGYNGNFYVMTRKAKSKYKTADLFNLLDAISVRVNKTPVAFVDAIASTGIDLSLMDESSVSSPMESMVNPTVRVNIPPQGNIFGDAGDRMSGSVVSEWVTEMTTMPFIPEDVAVTEDAYVTAARRSLEAMYLDDIYNGRVNSDSFDISDNHDERYIDGTQRFPRYGCMCQDCVNARRRARLERGEAI